MSHGRKQQQRGYSLAEILVAVAIFALIFVSILMIYDRSNRVFKTSVESSDMQQNTRIAFDKLVAELRMAGYDFDRDGDSSTAGVYQQPDEQLEYIGHGAITIRGNFDAESDAATDNGRELTYQPTTGQFPVVTTGNDEIVTYALRSTRAAANTDSLVFYADTRKRRMAYPGGADEQTVTIPNVDDCTDDSGNWDGCKNPPYTLYRVTLQDVDLTNPSSTGNFVFTPIAENIRRIRFYYYKDPAGTTDQLVAPNKGEGRYMVNSATPLAAINARAVRESIQSIRLELVGMNAVPDGAYISPLETSTNPVETSPVTALATTQQVAAARSFRQYPLASHIVPRNLGRRGMQEYDTRAPGAPTITSAAYGCCGVAYVTWTPPPSGIVDGYSVLYDVDPSGAFASEPVQAGLNTFAYVPKLDPAMAGGYHFVVVASNSFGSNRSLNVYPPTNGSGLVPRNRTKPEPPALVSGTGGGGTNPPAQANSILVRWTPPALNVDFGGQPPRLSNGIDARVIASPLFEISGYDIHRSLTPDFTPDLAPSSTTRIWQGLLTDAAAPVRDSATGHYVFTDTTSKQNCTTYYYKVRAVERCAADPAMNEPADVALAVSDFGDDIPGLASPGAPPAAPVNVTIDPASSCGGTGNCSIILRWPKVTQDTSTPTPATIQVPRYQVKRVTMTSGTPGATVETFVNDNPLNGSPVTFTDTPPVPPNANTVYAYTVRALQCGDPDADPNNRSAYSSPPKVFPCNAISITPPVALDGDGSQGNPWLIGNPTATLGVTTSTDIATITANLYNATTGTLIGPVNANTSPTGPRVRAYDIAMGANDSTVYRIDITVTDTNGCSNTEQRWLEDSPVNCCIQPWKEPDGTVFNNAVVTQGAAADKVVIKFFNQCSPSLTITGLTLQFRTQGNRDLESITYPGAAGGTIPQLFVPNSTSPVTITSLPTGAKTTIDPQGSATTYEITLDFDVSSDPNDILGFCVTYTSGAAAASTTCRIAPAAAANCN